MSAQEAISGLKLAPGEIVFFRKPAALIEQRTITTGYQGGSRGVSFRLFKGVSYRVGAHRGQLIRSRNYVPVSDGILTLTGKRIIYSASTKSFSLAATRIEICEIARDCLIIGTADKPRILKCSLPPATQAELATMIGFAPTIIETPVFSGKKQRGCLSRILRATIIVIIASVILAIIGALADGCGKQGDAPAPGVSTN